MEKIIDGILIAALVAFAFANLMLAASMIVDIKLGTGPIAMSIIQMGLYILIAVLAMPMLEEYWFDDPEKIKLWSNKLQGVFNN